MGESVDQLHGPVVARRAFVVALGVVGACAGYFLLLTESWAMSSFASAISHGDAVEAVGHVGFALVPIAMVWIGLRSVYRKGVAHRRVGAILWALGLLVVNGTAFVGTFALSFSRWDW